MHLQIEHHILVNNNKYDHFYKLYMNNYLDHTNSLIQIISS